MKLFGQVVHEKKIFKDLLNKNPSWGPYRGHALFVRKLEAAFHWGCFMPSLVKIYSMVLEKKSFRVEFNVAPFCPLTGPKREIINFFTQILIFINWGCFLPNLVNIRQS